jgi:hypothetical protein
VRCVLFCLSVALSVTACSTGALPPPSSPPVEDGIACGGSFDDRPRIDLTATDDEEPWPALPGAVAYYTDLVLGKRAEAAGPGELAALARACADKILAGPELSGADFGARACLATTTEAYESAAKGNPREREKLARLVERARPEWLTRLAVRVEQGVDVWLDKVLLTRGPVRGALVVPVGEHVVEAKGAEGSPNTTPFIVRMGEGHRLLLVRRAEVR